MKVSNNHKHICLILNEFVNEIFGNLFYQTLGRRSSGVARNLVWGVQLNIFGQKASQI
jgi:hypothetical protein